MKSIYSIAFALVLLSCAVPSAEPAQKQSASADHIGLTCTQILQISSTDWIKKFTAAKDATEPSTIQAISAYGKCYEARTTRLATSLGKSGKGPLMGARGNFGDFDHALNDFTAKALVATDPPAGSQKKAYAALYAEQFRYDFYRQYQQKNFNPPLPRPVSDFPVARTRMLEGKRAGLGPDGHKSRGGAHPVSRSRLQSLLY